MLDAGRQVQRQTSTWEQDFSKGLDKTWAEMGGAMHLLPPDDLKKMSELLQVASATT